MVKYGYFDEEKKCKYMAKNIDPIDTYKHFGQIFNDMFILGALGSSCVKMGGVH